jgi:hypothetical protein
MLAYTIHAYSGQIWGYAQPKIIYCTEIEKERLIRIDGFAEFARRNMLVSIVRTNTSFHGSQKSPIDACFGQGGYGYG